MGSLTWNGPTDPEMLLVDVAMTGTWLGPSTGGRSRRCRSGARWVVRPGMDHPGKLLYQLLTGCGGLVGGHHVGGDAAAVADLVALLPGPPADRLGVWSGLLRRAAPPGWAATVLLLAQSLL